MSVPEHRKIAAARALLNWTQRDLAATSGVSINSIVAFENNRSTPVRANRAAIYRTFLEHGVDFTEHGVFLCRKGITPHSPAPADPANTPMTSSLQPMNSSEPAIKNGENTNGGPGMPFVGCTPPLGSGS